MKRVILSIFLAAVLLAILGSHRTLANRSEQLRLVPPSEIHTTDGTIIPSTLGGKKVSITFWSSNDAGSRLENIQKSIEARADSGMVHIGMNIDDAPALFREYLRHDNLHADTNQYLADEAAARTLQDTYGYGTMYY